ncbi:uncharacterized protein LOC111715379 [Eurytemora carolleeae]|uniref:uncharacterized protein LOC111715379 n=1 Tax=Eurytemora carolleeae TaxID=1294199 RepID=UPI000C7566CA|nr:uncharacterized protein LOC111715379 [Eurytemora carolleeae]|eukprot:XP_023346456.1 uncharacterized protein LOC111715379 [Eurytemora affinis]
MVLQLLAGLPSILLLITPTFALNVYVVSDKNNYIADDSTKVAFDYLASRPTDPVTINAKKFSTLEGTDPKVVIDKVCGDLDAMIDGGQTPDLLLDLTRGGVNSEVVKSLREVAVIRFQK